MNELLKFALAAHGGMERWTELTELKADLFVTGALWQVKNQVDALRHIRVEADLHQQRITTHIMGQNKRLHFAPDFVSAETEDGTLLERQNQPRASFSGQQLRTPWDDLHVAYFDSYALWTYFTIPFLYAYPGFVTEELPPWEENGETWSPLSVVFPREIASHTQKQISYFGPDGLLRRHEYTAAVVLSVSPGEHDASAIVQHRPNNVPQRTANRLEEHIDFIGAGFSKSSREVKSCVVDDRTESELILGERDLIWAGHDADRPCPRHPSKLPNHRTGCAQCSRYD
jgi:hypothetical protein